MSLPSVKDKSVRLSHLQIKAFSAAVLSLSRPSTLEEFPCRVVEAMRPFLPCDFYAYHEFAQFRPSRNLIFPDYRADVQAFVEFLHQHPTVTAVKTHKLDSSVKISDFVTLRRWKRTDLHHHLFRPENQNYQLAFISQDPKLELGLALNRASRDFNEEERQMLDLIRPHLIRAFQNSRLYSELSVRMQSEGRGLVIATRSGRIRFATENARQYLERYAGSINGEILPESVRSWLQARLRDPESLAKNDLLLYGENGRLAIRSLSSIRDEEQQLVLHEEAEHVGLQNLRELGVTKREAEVLFWVSRGKRNSEIGIILGTKSKTITKHLERIFEKLSVETRTAAATVAIGYMSQTSGEAPHLPNLG